MIIRSLQESANYQRKRSGLPGAGPNWKERTRAGEPNLKSFADYLEEAFEGELVQKGAWFSDSLSELSKNNLKRI
ncbi:LIC12298 family protein [Leptospira noguchii]|uniref:Uncharacterized protein n=2 Tax=Leptospira noguchii TaxID=28182 RepID=T0GRK9_9LEPT|nr:hypothetical protein [Leptospira noguchii]EMO53323.1 hypothetical protein LEP1GSC172_1968 [Leptospira noguchii]EQA70026.1 hypothetical protein LEP1GSC059_1735 [Leptospira noguchii serovar Panama str. CZ214]MCH1913427.1 hypothetical protein [Leptospira noguchii]MCH1915299.1 hypothetical protein [Leptospira noguchii]UOG65154.1 hypothetical protein MAL04_06850 [Leptospira noguchii]